MSITLKAEETSSNKYKIIEEAYETIKTAEKTSGEVKNYIYKEEKNVADIEKRIFEGNKNIYYTKKNVYEAKTIIKNLNMNKNIFNIEEVISSAEAIILNGKKSINYRVLSHSGYLGIVLLEKDEVDKVVDTHLIAENFIYEAEEIILNANKNNPDREKVIISAENIILKGNKNILDVEKILAPDKKNISVKKEIVSEKRKKFAELKNIIAKANKKITELSIGDCKDLKPLNNLDELLYQFYVNLESECLFTMPIADLEKAWDIKILSKERAEGIKYYELLGSLTFLKKPYKTEKDAFYLEINQYTEANLNVFYILITDAYSSEHYTLFPNGNYPKLIPEPSQISGPSVHGYHPLQDNEPKNKNYNMYNTTYYWVNDKQTYVIYLIGTGYGVFEIKMSSKDDPLFSGPKDFFQLEK